MPEEITVDLTAFHHECERMQAGDIPVDEDYLNELIGVDWLTVSVIEEMDFCEYCGGDLDETEFGYRCPTCGAEYE